MSSYAGPGRYRHYKGGEYEVLGIGIHEHAKEHEPKFDPRNPEQLYVIYKPLTPGGILDGTATDFWIRGLINFNELVTRHPFREQVPRFEKIG